jgi:hypothetical protein
MAQAKRGQPQAEIVQFADLKARREARSADVLAALHVAAGDVRKGDVVLCALKRGGYALAVAVSDAEDGMCDIRQPPQGDAVRVVGRVVLVDDVRGD